MIDNNLNSEIPIQHTSPVASSLVEEKKIVTSSSKVISFPFPEASPQPDKANFTTRRAPITDAVLREVDRMLHAQAEQIEKDFNELENQETDKKLIDTILGIEDAGYELLSFMGNNIEPGLNFLARVLPRSILDQIPFSQKWDELGRIASMGATFLAALDTGAKGVALIYKTKILNQAQEFLKEYKTNFANQIAAQQANRTESNNIDQKTGMTAQQKKIQKQIDEWEIQLDKEEKAVAEEKRDFSLKTVSNILSLINTPLSYLPKDLILQNLNLASGVSWFLSGLDILETGIELKKVRQDSHTLDKWIDSYHKWKNENLPKFKIINDETEKTGYKVKRIGFTPSQPVVLSTEEHQNVLLTNIKTNSFAFSKNKLKECGIKIPSTITSKKDLARYLEENPPLIQKYTDFQHQLEGLNAIIYTSENLLAKREAIVNKKVLFLKHRFHTVEDKIQERKKQIFVKDMERVLTQTLQNPYCSVEEIEEQFNKWGFFTSPIPPQNHSLLSAFESFKNSKLQQKEMNDSLSVPQQNFINELGTWKNQTEAINQHFQHWFEIQDKESLVRDYIDHQETIEHTTKNALKQMVEKKHDLETCFQDFKLIKSHILFGIAATSLAISITFAILGLLTIPFGGAGAILLGLSIGSVVVSFGFLAAGYIHSSHYKPHTSEVMTTKFNLKLGWIQLKNAISTYSHQSKEMKLLEVAKILHQLHKSSMPGTSSTNEEYQKALADYQQAKIDFQESQEKADYWTRKLKKYESRITEAGWKDFAQYASLPPETDSTSFNTLDAFQQAFQACDLKLLSAETRTLLEVQLGIDVEALNRQMKKDPEGVKKSLQEFFALGDAGLIDFIRNQKARMKKGLLKGQSA